MKFNPYALLLTTGALMLATVVFAQTGTSVALLKAGATSVDKDVSSFAVRALSSFGPRTEVGPAREARLASIDRGDGIDRAEGRVASIDRAERVSLQ